MKYSAIITCTSGMSTGAIVQADSYSDTWRKLHAAYGTKAGICRMELVQILTHEKGIK